MQTESTPGNAPTDQAGSVTEAASAPAADGLTSEEAERRLAEHGENALPESEQSTVRKLLATLWGPIPWMIEIAAVLSAVVGHWEDFGIIVSMLVINSGVRFWEEHKADRAIEALRANLAPRARVLRDGEWTELPARRLVPGDVVRLKLGDIVPADVRLAEGEYLSIDQSALTGESLPVDEGPGDEAYSGSIVRMGEMTAVVTKTGQDTYFGRTVHLVESAQTTSHFQRAVLKIGNVLIVGTLVLVALILTVALFRGAPWVETVLFAMILTVAAIPVALPAVLSVTMAVGASRLAAAKAIVSRLVSIEEMAGMDVLCSDKTGTLTKNELTVAEPVVLDAESADDVRLTAALVSKAGEGDPIDDAIWKSVGDPDRASSFEELRFTPFDPVRKLAEAELRGDEGVFRAAKGAVQAILDRVDADAEERERASAEVDRLAERGYRALAVARSEPDDDRWRLLGILPLFDPPRDDSKETLEKAREMGLRVLMVTGDHLAIAKETARRLGLPARIANASDLFGDGGDSAPPEPRRVEAADGFAEVFPEHKFEIVRAFQSLGHIVGMTGDGVNDAPALEQADVGIAVSGATEAARASADLVLTAPGLSVIGGAVAESRRIFARMRSYAIYRIAETTRVLLFMTASILVFDFYPVTAVMIVLLAILNDFPIMMIAYDNAPVAPRPVRWDMRRVLTISGMLGLLGVVATFVLFWYAERRMGLGRETIQTLVFLKLLVAGHLTIYITRTEGFVTSRPWPSWKLVVVAETTQVLGTLAAVYGWFVEPIGWTLALGVWAYALAWFVVNALAKWGLERWLELGPPGHAQHWRRTHRPLRAQAPA